MATSYTILMTCKLWTCSILRPLGSSYMKHADAVKHTYTWVWVCHRYPCPACITVYISLTFKKHLNSLIWVIQKKILKQFQANIKTSQKLHFNAVFVCSNGSMVLNPQIMIRSHLLIILQCRLLTILAVAPSLLPRPLPLLQPQLDMGAHQVRAGNWCNIRAVWITLTLLWWCYLVRVLQVLTK